MGRRGGLRAQTKDKNDIDFQRSFFDGLFEQLQLKTNKDWKNVKKSFITKNGGVIILKQYKTLQNAFKNIYPESNWDFLQKKYPLSYFSKRENQHLFLEQYMKKKNLILNDLPNVMKKEIVENLGGNLLRYYKFDWKLALTTLYPHYPWPNFYQFKSGFWKKIENQRDYFDRMFVKLNLKKIQDWEDINWSTLERNGFFPILACYQFDYSKTLISIYPHITWRFKGEQKLHKFQRRLRRLQKVFKIQSPTDWQRIPHRKILVLRRYLPFFYPETDWNNQLSQLSIKKSSQYLIFKEMQSILPNYLIIENFRHPRLLSGVDFKLELDFFCPALNLAIEYQGEFHFDDTLTPVQYQIRDEYKSEICNSHSIKLISIPYWANITRNYLQSEIFKALCK